MLTKVKIIARSANLDDSVVFARDEKEAKVFKVSSLMDPSEYSELKISLSKEDANHEEGAEDFCNLLKTKCASIQDLAAFSTEIEKIKVAAATTVVAEKKEEVQKPAEKPALSSELRDRIKAKIQERQEMKKKAAFIEAIDKGEEKAEGAGKKIDMVEAVDKKEAVDDMKSQKSTGTSNAGKKVKTLFNKLPSSKPEGFTEAVDKSDESKKATAAVVEDLLKKVAEKDNEVAELKKAQEKELKAKALAELISVVASSIEISDENKKKLEGLDLAAIEVFKSVLSTGKKIDASISGGNVVTAEEPISKVSSGGDVLDYLKTNWNKVS